MDLQEFAKNHVIEKLPNNLDHLMSVLIDQVQVEENEDGLIRVTSKVFMENVFSKEDLMAMIDQQKAKEEYLKSKI